MIDYIGDDFLNGIEEALEKGIPIIANEGLSDLVLVLIAACIPAFISILGFIVTYFLNKRNFTEEVQKQKVNIHLDKISDLPYVVQELLDFILEKNKQKDFEKTFLSRFKNLMSTIFAYGSKDAISLIVNMQELNYQSASAPDKVDSNMLIAYYTLLICQIKYDLTGIEINPEFWYRMKLTDYSKSKQKLDKANNEIVKNLRLSPFLNIK